MKLVVHLSMFMIALAACEPSNTAANGDVMGKWRDERPLGFGATITMYRDAESILMEWKFDDGSVLRRELIEKLVSGERRLEEMGGSSFGEYYIIDSKNNLRLYDVDGLIRIAQPAR